MLASPGRPHPAPSLRAIVYGPRPDCVHSDALRHRNNVPASSATGPKVRKKRPQRSSSSTADAKTRVGMPFA
jgi:hypothetical protein